MLSGNGLWNGPIMIKEEKDTMNFNERRFIIYCEKLIEIEK